MNFRDYKSVFVVGEPGSGKSRFLKNYLEEIIDDAHEDAEVMVFSKKDWGYRSGKIVMSTDIQVEDIQHLAHLLETRTGDEPRLYVFIDGVRHSARNVGVENLSVIKALLEKGLEKNIVAIVASSARDSLSDLCDCVPVVELK